MTARGETVVPSADSFWSHIWRDKNMRYQCCIKNHQTTNGHVYTVCFVVKGYYWPFAVGYSLVSLHWAFPGMVNKNKCNSLCVYSSLCRGPAASRTLWSTNPPLLLCQKRSFPWNSMWVGLFLSNIHIKTHKHTYKDIQHITVLKSRSRYLINSLCLKFLNGGSYNILSHCSSFVMLWPGRPLSDIQKRPKCTKAKQKSLSVTAVTEVHSLCFLI